MTIDGKGVASGYVGLGPLAVAPEQQRKGVGSALMRHGIERCREAGYEGIVLLGSTEYYPRFGFVPARTYNLHPADEGVPASNFQALLMGAKRPRSAQWLRYAPQFFSIK